MPRHVLGASGIRMATAPRMARVLGFTRAGEGQHGDLPGYSCRGIQVEVLGMMLVAREYGGRVVRGGRMTICSYSQATIRAIGAHTTTSVLDLECRDKQEQLCEQHQFNLMGVPG